MPSVSLDEFVLTTLATACNVEPSMLTLDTALDEMGVDSMSLMATIAQIEAVYDCQFVSDQVIGLFQAERVRDVVLLVTGMVGEDRRGDRRPG